MKIVTWNINSVRARLDRLLGWLESTSPDVVCLQETKATDKDFPALEIRGAGYGVAYRGQKSYNGVAILARDAEPEDVESVLPGDDEDQDARMLAATVNDVRVVTVYVPNGREVGHDHYKYKLRWLERLHDYVAEHSPAEPLVVCGDYNVAPDEQDVYDPKRWEGKCLFSDPERAAFRRLLDWGLTDALRVVRPRETVFTWWDYRRAMFPRDMGLRIDHLLVTRPLADRILSVTVDRKMREGEKPSDHAPVVLELEMDA